MEPAVLVDDRSGGLGILVVAHHDAVAPDAQLSVRLELIIQIIVALSHSADVLFILRVVDDAVAAGLGSAVGLHHEHPVVCHIQHRLRVEHSRGADGHPQLTQTLLAAAHHVLVQGVHDHRHHRHDLTGHPLDLLIEVADIAADVQAPARVRPREQADERAQMEHGQHRVLADHKLRVVLILHHVLTDLHMGTHDAEEVALAQHHALAASGGAGGEHQHHQVIVADAAGHFCHRLIAAETIHRAQDAAVGGFQLLLGAVVVTIGQDGGGLHQPQLVGQLVPALVLVEQYQHTARQKDAEGVHGVFVTVFVQQADLFALDIRDSALEVADRTADIPRIVLIMDYGHLVRILIMEAERHTLRKTLLHIQRDQIINVVQYLDHCFFLPSCHSTQPCAALCPVYNIFQCNAILLQHLISIFDNFQLHISGHIPAKFYLSLQSSGFYATIFSAKYQFRYGADCKTKLTVSIKSIILAIYHGNAV